jgi:hypothetical protein
MATPIYPRMRGEASITNRREEPMASGDVVALYAVPIHQCIERGDLAEMKALAEQAEAHLGEVRDALDKLNAEIEKAEG